MITLEIGNSISKLTGLTPAQEKSVRDLLSYTVDAQLAFFSGRYGPRKISLLTKRGEFPTGLMTKVLNYAGLPSPAFMSVKDSRKKPTQKLVLAGNFIKPLYVHQINAIDRAARQYSGTISCPTGSGKSLIIAGIIDKLKLRTLIVVPTIEIKNQLISTLVEIFGHTHNIQVYNIGAAVLKDKKDFDCLIIDECHHAAAKTYQKLNKAAWTGIYHRYCLTATPFRNNPEETLLFQSIAGDLIYQLNYVDAVNAGCIVPVEAYYIELPKQKTDAYTWAQVYSQLVVNNEHRNQAIANLLLELSVNHKKSLCLVKEIKHGDNIRGICPFPFANGQDEDSRAHITSFNEGKVPALLGTTGVLGEGVDTKPCEFVIIAGLGKAKSAFMQQVGRAVRTYPGKEKATVIIFKDKSHKFTLRHFNTQCKILREEYGVEPTKLEI